MSKLSIVHFFRAPIERMETLSVGDRVELLTHKRDRKIVILKTGDSTYDVLESGFKENVFPDVPHSDVLKWLKRLKPIEFPKNRTFFIEVVPAKRVPLGLD